MIARIASSASSQLPVTHPHPSPLSGVGFLMQTELGHGFARIHTDFSTAFLEALGPKPRNLFLKNPNPPASAGLESPSKVGVTTVFKGWLGLGVLEADTPLLTPFAVPPSNGGTGRN